jgi:hypothetical protein
MADWIQPSFQSLAAVIPRTQNRKVRPPCDLQISEAGMPSRVASRAETGRLARISSFENLKPLFALLARRITRQILGFWGDAGRVCDPDRAFRIAFLRRRDHQILRPRLASS